jgi:hypothetical protein
MKLPSHPQTGAAEVEIMPAIHAAMAPFGQGASRWLPAGAGRGSIPTAILGAPARLPQSRPPSGAQGAM